MATSVILLIVGIRPIEQARLLVQLVLEQAALAAALRQPESQGGSCTSSIACTSTKRKILIRGHQQMIFHAKEGIGDDRLSIFDVG